MHANGRLWYYLFGKDIGCALLCRIFRILKRILVWNWQLLKQARIRSWESWSARWSYRWATSEKDCPACAGQVNGCAGRMWWTYAQTLSEEFPAASPWVWPERQMRGVRCAGWPRPGVAFPAYDSKTEPHGIVFTYRKDTFGESFFSSVPLYFSISSIAMGNNFTTYATPVFIRLPISHVPPSESVWILSYVMAFKST